MSVLAFLLVAIVPMAASAATVCVSATAPPGGTGACWSSPFHTIQEAINKTTAGDTIQIGAGIYRENVVLSGDRELVGVSGGRTRLSSSSTSLPALYLGVHGATIRRITFDSAHSDPAIQGIGDRQVVISECVFMDDGIRIPSGDVLIENNEFNSYGIRVIASASNATTRIRRNVFRTGMVGVRTFISTPGLATRVAIADNDFTDVDNAIILGDLDGYASVYANLIQAGYNGITIEGGRDVAIYNNVLQGQLTGIDTTLGSSLIIHNTLRDIRGEAIRCTADTWEDVSEVVNNVLVDNAVGMMWGSGCLATIQNNAAYNRSFDFIGMPAGADLGGNITGLPIPLSPDHRPSHWSSPIVDAALGPFGAHLLTDFYGTSRATNPDIGACEYVGN